MQLAAAFDLFQEKLKSIRQYVGHHNTFEDLARLNEEYVPENLQDEIDFLIDLGRRLTEADPNDDGDDAVEVPVQPTRG